MNHSVTYKISITLLLKYALFLNIFIFPIFSVSAEESIDLSKDKWEVLAYSGIKPNTVHFTDNSLTIRVDQSAGPLVYRLKKAQPINEIVIDAEILGTLKLNKLLQGSKGNDDFSLGIGLVYQGNKRLGFMQKAIAASWVKKLYSMAPKNIGISHVEFFNVYQDERLKNKKEAHELSDLFMKNHSVLQTKDGKINAVIKVPSNLPVLALWINSDGDDTKSKFAVNINTLTVR